MIKVNRAQLTAFTIIGGLSLAPLTTEINAIEKEPRITATNGLAAGGDIRNNNITINRYSLEQLRQMIRGEVQGGSSDKADKLSLELKVTKKALSGFFKILKQNNVPTEKLAETLALIAHQHKSTLERLSVFNPEDQAIKKVIEQARSAIDNSDYDRADQLLERVESAEIEAARKAEKLAIDAQDKANNKWLNAAAIRAGRGAASLTQLNYRQAAKHFKAARELVPSINNRQRYQYLHSYGYALYRQGTERVDNSALENVIQTNREILKGFPREQFPQYWAMSQNNLGTALKELGIRTDGQAGAALHAEAVIAYRNALQIYTHKQLPQQWALTQNNLGNVLSEQGTRTSGQAGTASLTEAVTAFRNALQIRTRKQLPLEWALTQNNLGITLKEQGIRTGGQAGVALLAEAVSTIRNALQIRTRKQQPQQWAATQNNLGIVLHEQGIRTGGQAGAALLAEAVIAYRNALQIRTRNQLPQDWATTQNNLGNALSEQGIRTSGQAGTALLAEAVTAYRNALQIYTRKELPQKWATTQNNLGTALKEQGIRTSGQAGTVLLAEAVTVYRNALQIRTRKQLPQQWATTQNNLGNVLSKLGKLNNNVDLIKQAIAAIKSVDLYYEAMGNSRYALYFEDKLKSLNLMIKQ